MDEDAGAEEGTPRGEFRGGGVRVGDAGGAVCGEGADEGVEAEESGDYAAWVDRGEVRDVVEGAGEEEVAC